MKNIYCQMPLLVMIGACSFFIIASLNEVLLPGTVVFLRAVLALITIGIILRVQRMKILWTELPWGLFLFYGILQFFLPWTFITFALGNQVAVEWIALLNAVFMVVLLFFCSKCLRWADIRNRVGKNFYYFIGIVIATALLQQIINSGVELWLVFLAAVSLGGAGMIYQQYFNRVFSYLLVTFCSLLWATPFAFILMMETSPGTIKYIYQTDILIEVIFLGVVVSGVGVVLSNQFIYREKDKIRYHGFIFGVVLLFSFLFSTFQTIYLAFLIVLGCVSLVMLFMLRRM